MTILCGDCYPNQDRIALTNLNSRKFCAYHNEEHPVADFNPTQLCRLNSSWCRKALAENKRLKAHGLESNSKASGKGGRPKWDTKEDRRKIKLWIDEGRSYSWIGRQYDPPKQAAVISKLAREQGWESVDAKKFAGEVQSEPTSKLCTKCGEEKPIEEFAIRYDRPSKRQSRCRLCFSSIQKENSHDYHINNRDKIRENKRSYRKRRPEIHRANVHKRRARKSQSRFDSFSIESVWERDQGLCFFCKEKVDGSLKYPDLYAPVIHHIHPLSKRGPHVLSNAALAHNVCNARAHDTYECPIKSWRVDVISNSLARQISEEKHYLHRKPSASFSYGLFDGNDLKGICVFGTTSSWRINKSICPSDPYCVMQLNRLWIDDNAPFGTASWFISRCLRLLPPRIIVSYADVTAMDSRNQRPHDGSVYRAANFYYAGRTSPHTDWRLPSSTRNVGKREGAEKVPVSAKERFWIVSGTPAERKRLRQMSEWPSL